MKENRNFLFNKASVKCTFAILYTVITLLEIIKTIVWGELHRR